MKIILAIAIFFFTLTVTFTLNITTLNNGNVFYTHNNISGVVFTSETVVVESELILRINQIEGFLRHIFLSKFGKEIWDKGVISSIIFFPKSPIKPEESLRFYKQYLLNKLINNYDNADSQLSINEIEDLTLKDIDLNIVEELYNKDYLEKLLNFFDSGFNYISSHFYEYKRQIKLTANFIYITFFIDNSNDFDYWTKKNVNVLDGGPAFFNIIMDLNSFKIVYIYINGVA